MSEQGRERLTFVTREPAEVHEIGTRVSVKVAALACSRLLPPHLVAVALAARGKCVNEFPIQGLGWEEEEDC